MVNGLPNVVVVADSSADELRARANDLAAKLKLPAKMPASSAAKPDFLLVVSANGLELREPDMKPGHGLRIDFSTLNPKQAARKGGFSRKQPLARAMGKGTKTVIDCTAGLGHDAALLACMGFEVIAIERSPIIAALLADALDRANQNEELRVALGGRLRIVNADAREFLSQQLITPSSLRRSIAPSLEATTTCGYFDPMFPPKRKSSAFAKKEIRMIRAIVGDDADAADLLAMARSILKRVAVKRPNYAVPLADKPTAVIESKLVRYDIYVQA
jgi:16S rRNA (guanine1516-N2)-methyltransferase